ncbi:hypothetical protein D3C73_468300 [compost metagenome]
MILHQDNVGGLNGAVGAFAHRNAQLSSGKCRSVVNTIANHGDTSSGRQFLDLVDLLLRQETGVPIRDACRLGYSLSCTCVITGQHDRMFNPGLVQPRDHVPALGANLVCEPGNAQNMLRISDKDNG